MAQRSMPNLIDVGASPHYSLPPPGWVSPDPSLLELANKRAGIQSSFLSYISQKYDRAANSNEAFKKTFLTELPGSRSLLSVGPLNTITCKFARKIVRDHLYNGDPFKSLSIGASTSELSKHSSAGIILFR